MADNRKYYYLKLKEDFFDTDEMKILESMKDGYLYSNILLKLYLKSLSNSGRLMYRNVIPYTPEILATLTGHQVGTVEKALDVFKKLDLIEMLDNGAIYMMDIQNFIGQSSSEADRQREYYNRMKGKTKQAMNLVSHGLQYYSERVIDSISPYAKNDAGLIVLVLRHLADEVEKNNPGAKELAAGMEKCVGKPSLQEIEKIKKSNRR